jgi:hypothetical protein
MRARNGARMDLRRFKACPGPSDAASVASSHAICAWTDCSNARRSLRCGKTAHLFGPFRRCRESRIWLYQAKSRNGSDGTRTRGLRRDRTRRGKRRPTTQDANRLQMPQVCARARWESRSSRTTASGAFGPLLGQRTGTEIPVGAPANRCSRNSRSRFPVSGLRARSRPSGRRCRRLSSVRGGGRERSRGAASRLH